MSAEKYLNLMHQEIDGRNTLEESAELHDYLSRNPEAQSLFDKLNTTSQILEQLPEEEAPADLENKVIAAIDPARYKQAEKHNPLPFKSIQISWQQVGTFATGLAAGLLLFALFQGGFKVADQRMRGTIGAESRSTAFEAVEVLPIQLTDLAGEVTLMRSDKVFSLGLSLQSREKHKLKIIYPENDFPVSNIIFSESTKNSNIALKDDNIEITHFGEQQCTIYFRNSTNSSFKLILQIYQQNTILLEQTLPEK